MSRHLAARRPVALAVILSAVAVVAAACGGAASPSPSPSASAAPSESAAPASPTATPLDGTLTVYSGRTESLIGPVIERFEAATGVEVEVKYGDTAELAATILEEGSASPADVYIAQDAGALGAVAAEGILAGLPSAVLDRVDVRFRSPAAAWVGVSGRARVAAYDIRAIADGALPPSILDFTDPAWKGRLGWAPTNGSFQAFVTALRVLEGEDAARAWLEGIAANEPKVYEGNNPVVAAIAAGEIEVGFVNHYYALQQAAEQGPQFPVANHFFAGGDPGALVNVAGAGILTTSANPAAALAFVEFLLADETQAYFAAETFEYPLVPGIEIDERLVPLDELEPPDIDLSDLSDLQGTLRLLSEVGIL
ncbi:MAG TPA: iron ABC transporter substrate-binding protein [Candidatus Limnocylindrales bacterium]|nr:iron ABC transporter substrate-binding protein [Candidatus Limnocylindrales bacterium]